MDPKGLGIAPLCGKRTREDREPSAGPVQGPFFRVAKMGL